MRLDLRFDDPAEEAAFRRADDEDSRRRRAVMCGVGGFLFAVFGFADAAVADNASSYLAVRLPVSAAALACGLAFARGVARQHHEALACAICVVVGWATEAGWFYAGAPDYYIAGGLMVTAVGLFTLASVRTAAATLTAGVLLAGLIPSAAVNAESAADAVVFCAIVSGGLIFGVLGSWLFEDLRRREYRLLHAILPDDIVTRLRRETGSIAEAFDEVTVLFADVAGFTPVAATMPPAELVRRLDELFSDFDAICERHGVEKIKTIGDAYMAAAGVPRPDPDHAPSMAAVALEMLAAARRTTAWPVPLTLRIGMSSGPAVAGVIGRSKFAYDLWGDTVNTASRMESHGEPGQVVVSDTTRRLLGDRYAFGPPREVPVKGKGPMTTYVLLTPPAPARDEAEPRPERGGEAIRG